MLAKEARQFILNTDPPSLCCSPLHAVKLQVTPYQEDEVVLVCSTYHPLSKRESVSKKELESFKYVSLFQSSTVQAIRSTLAAQEIEWNTLQVVLVLHCALSLNATPMYTQYCMQPLAA